MQHLSGIDRRMGGRTEWESNYLVIRVYLATGGVDARATLLARAHAAAYRTKHDPTHRMFRARLCSETEFSYEYTDDGIVVVALCHDQDDA
jgi:hypothetical protein